MNGNRKFRLQLLLLCIYSGFIACSPTSNPTEITTVLSKSSKTAVFVTKAESHSNNAPSRSGSTPGNFPMKTSEKNESPNTSPLHVADQTSAASSKETKRITKHDLFDHDTTPPSTKPSSSSETTADMTRGPCDPSRATKAVDGVTNSVNDSALNVASDTTANLIPEECLYTSAETSTLTETTKSSDDKPPDDFKAPGGQLAAESATEKQTGSSATESEKSSTTKAGSRPGSSSESSNQSTGKEVLANGSKTPTDEYNPTSTETMKDNTYATEQGLSGAATPALIAPGTTMKGTSPLKDLLTSLATSGSGARISLLTDSLATTPSSGLKGSGTSAEDFRSTARITTKKTQNTSGSTKQSDPSVTTRAAGLTGGSAKPSQTVSSAKNFATGSTVKVNPAGNLTSHSATNPVAQASLHTVGSKEPSSGLGATTQAARASHGSEAPGVQSAAGSTTQKHTSGSKAPNSQGFSTEGSANAASGQANTSESPKGSTEAEAPANGSKTPTAKGDPATEDSTGATKQVDSSRNPTNNYARITTTEGQKRSAGSEEPTNNGHSTAKSSTNVAWGTGGSEGHQGSAKSTTESSKHTDVSAGPTVSASLTKNSTRFKNGDFSSQMTTAPSINPIGGSTETASSGQSVTVGSNLPVPTSITDTSENTIRSSGTGNSTAEAADGSREPRTVTTSLANPTGVTETAGNTSSSAAQGSGDSAGKNTTDAAGEGANGTKGSSGDGWSTTGSVREPSTQSGGSEWPRTSAYPATKNSSMVTEAVDGDESPVSDETDSSVEDSSATEGSTVSIRNTTGHSGTNGSQERFTEVTTLAGAGGSENLTGNYDPVSSTEGSNRSQGPQEPAIDSDSTGNNTTHDADGTGGDPAYDLSVSSVEVSSDASGRPTIRVPTGESTTEAYASTWPSALYSEGSTVSHGDGQSTTKDSSGLVNLTGITEASGSMDQGAGNKSETTAGEFIGSGSYLTTKGITGSTSQAEDSNKGSSHNDSTTEPTSEATNQAEGSMKSSSGTELAANYTVTTASSRSDTSGPSVMKSTSATGQAEVSGGSGGHSGGNATAEDEQRGTSDKPNEGDGSTTESSTTSGTRAGDDMGSRNTTGASEQYEEGSGGTVTEHGNFSKATERSSAAAAEMTTVARFLSGTPAGVSLSTKFVFETSRPPSTPTSATEASDLNKDHSNVSTAAYSIEGDESSNRTTTRDPTTNSRTTSQSVSQGYGSGGAPPTKSSVATQQPKSTISPSSANPVESSYSYPRSTTQNRSNLHSSSSSRESAYGSAAVTNPTINPEHSPYSTTKLGGGLPEINVPIVDVKSTTRPTTTSTKRLYVTTTRQPSTAVELLKVVNKTMTSLKNGSVVITQELLFSNGTSVYRNITQTDPAFIPDDDKTSTAPAMTCPQIEVDLSNSLTPVQNSTELSGPQPVGTMVVHMCSVSYAFSTTQQPLKIYKCLDNGKWTDNNNGEKCEYVKPRHKNSADL